MRIANKLVALLSFGAVFQAAPALESLRLAPAQPATKTMDQLRPDIAILKISRSLLHALKGSPSTANTSHQYALSYLEIGRAFERDENQPAANMAYSIAHKLDPGNSDITAYLANGLSRAYREQECTVLYTQLEGAKEQSPCVTAALALRDQRAYDYAGARKRLESAIKTEPGASAGELHYLLARTLARQGFSNDAAQRYQIAAEKVENKYLSLLMMAVHDQLLNLKADQEKHFRDAGKLLPDDPAWHTELGIALLNSEKREEEGVDELRDAVKCKRVFAKGFITLANYLSNHKRTDDAMRSLVYIHRLKPWFADIPQARAGVYKNMQQLDSAQNSYSEAIRMNPRGGVYYVDLASLYIDRKEMDKARDILNQALAKCPRYTPAWRKLGWLETTQGHWLAGKDCSQKAIALIETPVDRLNDLVKNELAINHARIGTCFYKNNDRDRAISEAKLFNELKFCPTLPAYLTIVKLRPNRLKLDNITTTKEQQAMDATLLADMLRETNQLGDCINEYKRATELSPDDVNLHSYFYEVLSEDGRWLEAAQEDLVISNKVVSGVAKSIDQWAGANKKKKGP